jgi:hypothetical protein
MPTPNVKEFICVPGNLWSSSPEPAQEAADDPLVAVHPVIVLLFLLHPLAADHQRVVVLDLQADLVPGHPCSGTHATVVSILHRNLLLSHAWKVRSADIVGFVSGHPCSGTESRCRLAICSSFSRSRCSPSSVPLAALHVDLVPRQPCTGTEGVARNESGVFKLDIACSALVTQRRIVPFRWQSCLYIEMLLHHLRSGQESILGL